MEAKWISVGSARRESSAARLRGRAALTEHKRLSARETRTLDLLGRFLQNKEIADELGVSLPVAEKTIRRLFLKFGAHRRAEVIVIWKSLE